MLVQYRYRISFCEFHSWHQCISLVCCADTHAISTWTLKEKFHISVWPCNCIFLYFFVWSSIICALSETLLGFYTENGASMCRVAKNWGVIQDRKEKDWSSFLKCLLTELGQGWKKNTWLAVVIYMYKLHCTWSAHDL